MLAGHLDTVPPFGEIGARIEGNVLWGLGSVDMKGGLAVMLDLLKELSTASLDVTMVFYVCEEIERNENGLVRLAEERPELLQADAAVLMEPTGGSVEAGCQGTMRAKVTLRGKRAHTARPFMGLNALHRLGDLLRLIGSYEPRTVVLDGCSFTEQLQAVSASGGIAGNVVPDLANVTVNHRFAPDRDVEEASVWLTGLLASGTDQALGDEIEVVDSSPAAPPALSNPILARLVDLTGKSPRAKVGWTDVATFGELSIPATNLGPGDPLLAHTADEHVSANELQGVRNTLGSLIA